MNFYLYEGSELLLDINEFEYPKANETFRKIYKELWQEYYKCLKETYNEMRLEKIMYPIAFEALRGTLITYNRKDIFYYLFYNSKIIKMRISD